MLFRSYYDRLVGGSNTVAESGKYPLGFSFTISDQENLTVSKYLDICDNPLNVEHMDEKKRKKVLAPYSNLADYNDDKDAILQNQMEQVRKRGCTCKNGECGKKCPCAKKGLKCLYGLCKCEKCQNTFTDDPCVPVPKDDAEAGQKAALMVKKSKEK